MKIAYYGLLCTLDPIQISVLPHFTSQIKQSIVSDSLKNLPKAYSRGGQIGLVVDNAERNNICNSIEPLMTYSTFTYLTTSATGLAPSLSHNVSY